MLFVVQIRVIGDEHICGIKHLFHHRMPSVLDVYDALVVEGRLDIMISLSHVGKGCVYIQKSKGLCCGLYPVDLHTDGVPDLTEHFIFQVVELILSI